MNINNFAYNAKKLGQLIHDVQLLLTGIALYTFAQNFLEMSFYKNTAACKILLE